MNHCGECTLCCKLLGIASIDKQPGVWCKFCTPGKGCRIHDQSDYPADCETYHCLWRQWKDEGYPVADSLRPDRCKVIIDASNFENAHYVRCDRPNAWRKPEIEKVLGALASTGTEVYLITPSGTKRRLTIFAAERD